MAAGSPYLHVSYADELAIYDTPFRRFWLVVGIAVVAAAPLVLSSYYTNLLNLVGLAIIGALGLNLVTGYAGQISLGHAAFLGTGAYVAGAITFHLAGPLASFWLVVPASMLVGGVLGLLVGVPALRLRGLYLALATLAFHFVVIHALSRYQEYLRGLGTSIDILVPPPDLGFATVRSYEEWFYLLLTINLLVIAFVTNLVRTRAGRAWLALRDNEVAAEVIGVDLVWYKLLAFIISSALAALSGCLFAYYLRAVNVENFSLALSIQYLAMIIVGGLASVMGAILGAAFVVLLPYAIDQLFDVIPVPERFIIFRNATTLGIFGLVMMFFLLVEPLGLVGIWLRVRTFFELWPFKFKPLESGER